MRPQNPLGPQNVSSPKRALVREIFRRAEQILVGGSQKVPSVRFARVGGDALIMERGQARLRYDAMQRTIDSSDSGSNAHRPRASRVTAALTEQARKGNRASASPRTRTSNSPHWLERAIILEKNSLRSSGTEAILSALARPRRQQCAICSGNSRLLSRITRQFLSQDGYGLDTIGLAMSGVRTCSRN